MGGSPRIERAAQIRLENPNLTTEESMKLAGYTEEEAKDQRRQSNVRQKTHRLMKSRKRPGEFTDFYNPEAKRMSFPNIPDPMYQSESRASAPSMPMYLQDQRSSLMPDYSIIPMESHFTQHQNNVLSMDNVPFTNLPVPRQQHPLQQIRFSGVDTISNPALSPRHMQQQMQNPQMNQQQMHQQQMHQQQMHQQQMHQQQMHQQQIQNQHHHHPPTQQIHNKHNVEQQQQYQQHNIQQHRFQKQHYQQSTQQYQQYQQLHDFDTPTKNPLPVSSKFDLAKSPGGSPRVELAARVRLEDPSVSTEEAMKLAGFSEQEAKDKKKQNNVRQKTHRMTLKQAKTSLKASPKDVSETVKDEIMRLEKKIDNYINTIQDRLESKIQELGDRLDQKFSNLLQVLASRQNSVESQRHQRDPSISSPHDPGANEDLLGTIHL